MNEGVEIAALRMSVAGLPRAWVLDVAALADTNDGVRELMDLWTGSASEPDRDAAIAALQDCLDDAEGQGPFVRLRTSVDAEAEVERRRRYKAALRALVEAQGGVSIVARAAGLPQPSLSRLLNSGSWPRPRTLTQLARALGRAAQEISPESLLGPQPPHPPRVADWRYRVRDLGEGAPHIRAADPQRRAARLRVARG